jgi:hypothetical protein
LSIRQMIMLEHLISKGNLTAASYKTDAKWTYWFKFIFFFI